MSRYFGILMLFSIAQGQAAPPVEPDTGWVDSTRPMRACQVGPVVSVVKNEGNLYLGTYGGILVLSASDTASPKKVAEFPVLEIVYGLALHDGFLYVSNGTDGMAVIDLSNPTRPHRASVFDSPGFTYDIKISGGFAFIADGDSGLMIVDVHTPTKPEYVATCPLPGRAYAVTVLGNYAYVTGLGAGLQVVDVGNPGRPVVVRSYKIGGWLRDVVIKGKYAYLAADYDGIKIVDLADGSEFDFDTPGYSYGVTLAGTLAYVADGSGLLILDVSDPRHPEEVGRYPAEGWIRRMWISGNLAYLAAGKSGMRAIDVSNPRALKEVGCYEIQ